jgi:hypothetical protein
MYLLGGKMMVVREVVVGNLHEKMNSLLLEIRLYAPTVETPQLERC